MNIKIIDSGTEHDVNSMNEGEQSKNLENFILTSSCMSTLEDNMTYKINRKVIINGLCKNIRANTEQEYMEKLLQLHNEESDNNKHLFGEYADEWFELFCKPNIETVTIQTYERQLNKYILPSLGDKYIEDITVGDIQNLFNDITTSKASKDKIKTVLNQVFEAAIDDNYLARNPLNSRRLRISGRESEPTKPYSVEQMRYIINHLDDIKKERDRIYIALQALHPMRLEEVLGLKWSDIDFENMSIHIQRAATHPKRNKAEVKEPKTKSSIRYIALSSLASKYLSPPGNKDEYILGRDTPLTYTEVRRMCKRIASDIGFDENITPIRFRTTVLTDIYSQTKDIKLVQRAAGHTTSAMTFQYYVKERSNINEAATAVERLYTEYQY